MKTRKRNTVLNSFSDDEDDKSLLRLNRSYQKPKTKSSYTTRTSPRRPKRPRKESSHVDEMKLAMEEFDQVLNGFKVSTGCRSSESKELWVDKYKPRSLEELAVNKKKVEEVKKWFQDRLDNSKIDEHENCAIIISGPPGVGKSATVHAIALHLGVTVREWNAPTPTVWSEHIHNSNIGMSYTSKLDEFELFVERVRKYGLISPSFPVQLESSVILLIDDIPVTYGRMAFERVKQILDLLVRSVQIPTAILFTDYGNEVSADHSACWLELQSSLERSGAHKVSFNPITHNSIKKTLSRICRQECCDLSAEQIDLISQGSGGDIRQAISSLQLFCLKPYPILKLAPSFKTDEEKKVNGLNTSNGGSLSFGRDETLTLFHALGKFLHNKRETKNINASDSNPFSLQQKFSRFPIKMDSPEKILCQAHGQARTVIDFLHENVLDFLGDEAMDDAWDVASYLGDADVLHSFFSKFWARYNEVENVLQSAAASVAVRGVLYGNAHPASSRWHVIRKPKLWQIEKSSLRNKHEIVSWRLESENKLSLCEASVSATEFMPAMKWLGYRSSCGIDSRVMSMQSDRKNEGNLKKMSLDQGESDSSDDDDIEDC